MRKWSRTYSLLFVSISLIMLASPAAAEPTQNSSSTEQGKSSLKTLDKATWLQDVDWNPENRTGVIEVTVYSEVPKPVYIEEIPDMRGKSGRYNPGNEPISLDTGENTIYVPINGRRILGVSIEDSNNGIYYKESIGKLLPSIGLPLLFFSAFTGFIITVLAQYWYTKRTTSKVKEGSGVMI